MECHREQNLERCACGSQTCARRGLCCECLAAHLSKRQFPACVFPADPATCTCATWPSR